MGLRVGYQQYRWAGGTGEKARVEGEGGRGGCIGWDVAAGWMCGRLRAETPGGGREGCAVQLQ